MRSSVGVIIVINLARGVRELLAVLGSLNLPVIGKSGIRENIFRLDINAAGRIHALLFILKRQGIFHENRSEQRIHVIHRRGVGFRRQVIGNFVVILVDCCIADKNGVQDIDRGIAADDIHAAAGRCGSVSGNGGVQNVDRRVFADIHTAAIGRGIVVKRGIDQIQMNQTGTVHIPRDVNAAAEGIADVVPVNGDAVQRRCRPGTAEIQSNAAAGEQFTGGGNVLRLHLDVHRRILLIGGHDKILEEILCVIGICEIRGCSSGIVVNFRIANADGGSAVDVKTASGNRVVVKNQTRPPVHFQFRDIRTPVGQIADGAVNRQNAISKNRS